MRININNNEILSRYFFAPINTGFAVDGLPTEKLIKFHRERSGHNIGISYVGNVAIGYKYVTNPGTLYFSENLEGWKNLVSAIVKAGSVPGIQIGCRLSPYVAPKKWTRSIFDSYIQGYSEYISDMPEAQFDMICEEFITTCRIALMVGFRVIQIHAAHGYFLSSLLNRKINRRSGRYSFESTNLIDNISRSIRAEDNNAIIDIRLSLFDGVEQFDDEILYRSEQISSILSRNIDIVSLSAGLYDIDKNLIYPDKKSGGYVYLDAAKHLAIKHSSHWWNVAGNIWEIDRKNEERYQNLTYSIGRSLIADPLFIEKTMQGRLQDITHCVRAGHCHYFSRGRQNIECKVNVDI